MPFECVLDVLVLDKDEQATINREVALPFVPHEGMLLAGLAERDDNREDDKTSALRVLAVIWEDNERRFWIDCGTVPCADDQDLDATLENWPDWEVTRRNARTIPAFVTMPALDLFDNPDNKPGYTTIGGTFRLVGHRQVDRAQLRYSLCQDDKVLYKDGTLAEEDAARHKEWLYNDTNRAVAAWSTWYARELSKYRDTRQHKEGRPQARD